MEKEPQKEILLKRRLNIDNNELLPKKQIKYVPINIGIIESNNISPVKSIDNTKIQLYNLLLIEIMLNNF